MTLEIRPSIFREYDIRGIAGKDLTAEFATALGEAYAHYIAARLRDKPANARSAITVSVGWDCRLSSDGYAAALIAGLARGGLDVVRLGVCPTPVTYFSVFHLNLDGGIMITGSHNPADYNGFKLSIGKETLHGSQIQDLRIIMEEHLRAKPVPRRAGKISDCAIIPPYIDHLVSGARHLKKKKIVIDAGNGTASTVAPELFSRLGAAVIPLYCEIDGRFPNHHPDPTVPANLKVLVETVRREGADFGVAFDGDSDRIGLVDDTGRIVFGDELMVIFARDILKEHPGATIISEVKCSHRLYNDIAKNGGRGIMWKTGHSLIKAKMRETGAALAGEMSGHMFFADRYFGYDDAIYAALRVYEIACSSSSSISSLLSDLEQMVATPEIRVDCEEEKKFRLVEETKKRLASKNKITDIDGVRVDFGDGWGLVRASNTQPVLVLRFEAPTEIRMKEIRTIVESALKDAARAIGHGPIEVSGGPGH
ncbi:MAG TPA: phosphomannomutase/phosphoglucomutase [Bdellovibrionota bacterium]|nr:phosphomannomutase/phosphoglucomutase [Bdellovibrionota bacterium]